MTTNSHSHEIDKFSNLAMHWWDPDGPLKTLHQINNIRLNFIKQHQKLPGIRLVDVGCGGGILSESLAASGAHVTGIDLSQDLINAAKLHLLESKLTVDYQCRSVESLALEQAGKFDVVTCMELLEHVPEPALLIQNCSDLLKPGGTFFVSTINRCLKAYLFAILGAEYVLRWLPIGTHDYKQFIKPSEMANWCEAAQLLPQATQGIRYNILSKTFEPTTDVSVNYLLYAKKRATT